MEAENKKERTGERRKYNELVNRLVAFVKKRDPRVDAYRQEVCFSFFFFRVFLAFFCVCVCVRFSEAVFVSAELICFFKTQIAFLQFSHVDTCEVL